jgi:ATP:ADP antiporter, AAA family
VLKTVREALILSEGSAELKSYLSAGQVVMLSILIPIYGQLVARMPRRKLLNVVTAFFTLCLIVFYILGKTSTVRLDVAFFIWIGIFNMMFVAQFWGFANDLYTKKQGERLFPIVGFGASLGAVLGARVAANLIKPFGVLELMLVGIVLLILQTLITNIVDRRAVGLRAATQNAGLQEAAPSSPRTYRSDAFGMVWGNRYLLMIAFVLLLLNWVNTTGEYILGNSIRAAAETAVANGQAGGMTVGQFIGTAYAKYFTLVNIISVVLQLFVVSRIVKFLGVPIGLAILPIVSLFSYGVLALSPVLGIILAAKVSENSLDYSLNNTVRNMLFLPCSHEEKFSAKQVIDSFFVRMGDVFSALLVFVGVQYFHLSSRGFALFNAFLVLVWLLLAILVGRRYRSLTSTLSNGRVEQVA